MAKREISIVLKAKNNLQAGLAKAGSQLKSFGENVVNIGKKLALAFAGGTAALAATMAKAQEFNKQIGQITTVSNLSFSQASAAVRKLSAEFGLAKEELTKGLYDALSKGVPQENVFDFMATASKTAIAGATTTAEAVDFLTSAMNAFQIPASEADKVADTLFQTVKLGGTTVTELASSFGKVGSLAAASGVELEQVMSALATLTKTGNGTAESTTMIRAAIIAMNKELGDGWAKTMTLQEGMQAMSDRANGSQNELRNMTGSVEAMNAILGMTGQNAQMAAGDLVSISSAAGAAAEAFGKMGDTAPLDKAIQAFNNLILVIGDNAIRTLGPYIEDWTKRLAAFAEEVDAWAKSGGMINLTAQIQGFVTEAVYRFQLLGNAFKVAAAVLRDVYGPPIQYVAGLIAAFVGKAQTDFRALGESLSYIASSIRRPWQFSMSELTSLFKRHAANTLDAQKDLISALKGEDVKLTEHGVAALTEREQIHQRYNERIKKVYEDQANALAQLENRKVQSTSQTASAIVAIEQQASDRIVDIKQEQLSQIKKIDNDTAIHQVNVEKEVTEKIVELNKNAKNEVTETWSEGLKEFAEIESKKVEISATSAKAVANSFTENFDKTLKNNVTTTSKPYIQYLAEKRLIAKGRIQGPGRYEGNLPTKEDIARENRLIAEEIKKIQESGVNIYDQSLLAGKPLSESMFASRNSNHLPIRSALNNTLKTEKQLDSVVEELKKIRESNENLLTWS